MAKVIIIKDFVYRTELIWWEQGGERAFGTLPEGSGL